LQAEYISFTEAGVRMIPTSQNALDLLVPGLQVVDLYENAEFKSRPRRKARIELQMEGLQRLAEAFVLHPESILQELANSAVSLCKADSAGVTLETRSITGETNLQWVAVAGAFSNFSHASFPCVNTACGTGIERGRPQLFRMEKAFYDRFGIQAQPVTDGILIPWRSGTVRGTVWMMAHGRAQAFDANDARLMETLANFAAMAFRQRRQQLLLIEQASAAAAAAMANELAHGINNPLQSLTNLVYLAAQDELSMPSRDLAGHMSLELDRVSRMVMGLLALPVKRARHSADAARSSDAIHSSEAARSKEAARSTAA
jgi:hypothetical protein